MSRWGRSLRVRPHRKVHLRSEGGRGCWALTPGLALPHPVEWPQGGSAGGSPTDGHPPPLVLQAAAVGGRFLNGVIGTAR